MPEIAAAHTQRLAEHSCTLLVMYEDIVNIRLHIESRFYLPGGRERNNELGTFAQLALHYD